MDKDQIIKALPKLSQKDLKQIKIRLDFLIQATNDSKNSRDKELFYATICEVYCHKTKNKLPFFTIFIKSKNKKSLDQTYLFITNYFNSFTSNIKIKGSIKIARQKFYILFAKLVISYLIEQKLPVSIVTILSHHEKFPGLIEIQFPGYIESGLVQEIL